ncbi:hypothetical protein [Chryseobacterium lathyri]|uniref:hypothetical protein n=1 Tax=Chryseobacterium lathyri TaxID=395933 RepID=UPI0027862AE9|nr:hypothetical protein [Chryseobacterium lathyri]MDQ0064671.1 glutathione synthase/RimK-type ligase-like ATP-grasp enzyme [Chryseobacterium lathyri]
MILIISKSGDQPTEQVANWLTAYKVPFFVLNDNIYDVLNIDFNKNTIFIGKYPIDAFKVVWFRRYPYALRESQKTDIRKNLYFSLIEYNLTESRALRDYLLFELKRRNVTWLTDPSFITENKLIQMKIAQSHGLSIPKTHIINNKKAIEILIAEDKELITKPIVSGMNFKSGNKILSMQTTSVNNKLNNIPEFFKPALLQQKIVRNFEVRSFYLLGKFFSTKIITTDNSNVDHRISVANEECRFEIYSLPSAIENKLKNLLESMNLNCASIDLIVTNENEHIFLEVNPVGQFTYHSVFNNTYLEIEIALALKKMLKQCNIKNT